MELSGLRSQEGTKDTPFQETFKKLGVGGAFRHLFFKVEIAPYKCNFD
jgi:hypothetical protein